MDVELKSTSTEMTPPKNVGRSKKAEEPKVEVVDRKDLNYLWKKSREIVRGRFVNDETPGSNFAHVYKEFKQDKIEKYIFKDQAIYEIPLGVAQHLNKNCKVPIYGLSKDEEGNSIEIITGWKKRVHFESLEFSSSFDGEHDTYFGGSSNTMKSLAR